MSVKQQDFSSATFYSSHWIRLNSVIDICFGSDRSPSRQDSYRFRVSVSSSIFFLIGRFYCTFLVNIHVIFSLVAFMYFWAIVFLVATTLVAIFKKDNSLDVVDNRDDVEFNVRQSYKLLWEILKLKPVQYTAVILLTVKVIDCDCK